MCEYCKCDPDNDVYPEPLDHVVMQMLLSEYWLEVEVERYAGHKNLSVTYVDKDTGDWQALVSIPIKFCPMCGEKLKNKEEQD